MNRQRVTQRTASDSALGQSANDYWRKRALDAVKGVLSQVEQEIMQQAQKVTEEEARQLGVQAPQYAPQVAAPVVTTEETVKASEPEKEPEKKENVEMPKNASEKTRVFTPRKTAGQPVVPSLIGKEKWHEVQQKFPQYTKVPLLTMLQVSPTKANQQAVSAVTETLDVVASKLEELGAEKLAAQLDVVSDLLTASVEESCKEGEKVEEAPKTETSEEKK